MTDVNETLKERGSRYGDYVEQTKISQPLKETMHSTDGWARLSVDKKDCLDMIAVKISRILNGNPEYADNWHDIIGYTTLVEQKLSRLGMPALASPAYLSAQQPRQRPYGEPVEIRVDLLRRKVAVLLGHKPDHFGELKRGGTQDSALAQVLVDFLNSGGGERL
tara:strand:+ start:5466 stop:5957 length:492 start_codon:yes stop_codon:yes gene_type:complete